MSALARYFMAQGYMVSGYDKTPSPLTDKLQQEGILVSFNDAIKDLDPIYVEHKAGVMVVYTPAIPADNVLLNFLKGLGGGSRGIPKTVRSQTNQFEPIWSYKTSETQLIYISRISRYQN